MKNKKGFTLIELLAVIVVLAIILVIAGSSVIDGINDSKEKAKYLAAKEIVSMAEAYFAVNTDKTYVSVKTLVDEGYLESDVTNPLTGENISNSAEVKNQVIRRSANENQEENSVELSSDKNEKMYVLNGYNYYLGVDNGGTEIKADDKTCKIGNLLSGSYDIEINSPYSCNNTDCGVITSSSSNLVNSTHKFIINSSFKKTQVSVTLNNSVNLTYCDKLIFDIAMITNHEDILKDGNLKIYFIQEGNETEIGTIKDINFTENYLAESFSPYIKEFSTLKLTGEGKLKLILSHGDSVEWHSISASILGIEGK